MASSRWNLVIAGGGPDGGSWDSGGVFIDGKGASALGDGVNVVEVESFENEKITENWENNENVNVAGKRGRFLKCRIQIEAAMCARTLYIIRAVQHVTNHLVRIFRVNKMNAKNSKEC